MTTPNLTLLNMSILYNPIKALHRLKNAGFTQEQAEAQVEILTEIIEEGLASKKDILELKNAFFSNEAKIKAEIEKAKLELENKIQSLELRITIRMTAIVLSTVGFFYTLEKFF